MKASSANCHILFYDGHCGLCHRWVRFLLRRDRAKRFNFSPLQGETISQMLSDAQQHALPDSIVVLSSDGQLLTKSSAVFFILLEIGGVWALLSRLCSLLPRAFTDLCYDIVARYRRKLFAAQTELCPIVPSELKQRFLK